jgi:hypothetical protein
MLSTGRDPITVTFNRAVIALGSDWGDVELPADKLPFLITLKSAGTSESVKTIPGECCEPLVLLSNNLSHAVSCGRTLWQNYPRMRPLRV